MIIILIVGEIEDGSKDLIGPFNMTDEEGEKIANEDRPDLKWMGWDHFPWGYDPKLQDW